MPYTKKDFLCPEGNLSLQDAVGFIYRMLPDKTDESMAANMDRALFENDLLQHPAKTPYNDNAQLRLAKLIGYLINSHKLSDWKSEQKVRDPRLS
jgi:hypothetical protein